MKEMHNSFFFGFFTLFIFFILVTNPIFADNSQISILHKTAAEYLQNGELREAINVYDEILEISPENIDAMLMKGIALSNLERH